MCSKNLDTQNMLTNHMIYKHDHPGDLFVCDLCEFITSRKTGLDIHISKKHKEIQQVDGNSSDLEESYAEKYWERDYMGTTYQNYLDVVEDINSLDLSYEEKQIEIERAKSKRMEDLLDYGFDQKEIEEMPPWH